MLQGIAISDESNVLDLLSHYAAGTPLLSLNKTFANQEKAKLYLAQYPVDVIFVYLRRGIDDELEFYKRLLIKPQLIFLCESGHLAAEAFAIGATDYLVTPFSIERFSQAVSKARQFCPVHAQMQTAFMLPCLTVRSASKLVEIPFSNIEYIRGSDDYVKIFFNQKKSVLSHISMKEVLGRLPGTQFVRIHRSTIVPVSKITEYRNGHIFLNEIMFPVGITYLSELRKILSRFKSV